jgi:putative restriction endonuclease
MVLQYGGARMKFWVGVTDNKWYQFLSELRPDEVNFWQPGGNQVFKVLSPNDMFLFKLHHPYNYIVGGGFFIRHSLLPVSLAWEAFGDKNGTNDYLRFLNAILGYKHTDRKHDPDPTIGCIILGSPFFFVESDWIPVPKSWSPNIVQGKSYDTDSMEGYELYKAVSDRISSVGNEYANVAGIVKESETRYGTGQLVYPRLGQGAFRVIVTEAYHRRCAITGEKTLPVLDAAHIRSFSQDGPHTANNGILLRNDMHTLFDKGYITITEDMQIEVSKRIKEDYGNGREYYAFHGKKLIILPYDDREKPSREFIQWHNENVYVS